MKKSCELLTLFTMAIFAFAGCKHNPAEDPELPESKNAEIELTINTTIESYSLVKIFDVIYLSDKSNANYKDYSVCKANEISDSVLQLKVNDYDESYALTINDKAVTVTEGKVAFQDILKNTIVGKNTINLAKDAEIIDSVEYTVEAGCYDCPSPALKIVTKEGSSAEVGESHIIKAGENLRYGVKAGTSSKIEFEVVQEDGKAYPAEIKTSFKVENATVEKNLVTINGKNKNTYEVKVSVDVPEEYKKPGAAYSGTASFTTKYDVNTGFVKSEGSGHDYKLSYSLDGKDYTEFSTASDTPSMYCFDEFGNVYFTYKEYLQSAYKKSVKKYSPETKETTEILSPNNSDRIRTISYDFDTSTLYVIYDDKFVTKCGETENTYDLYVYNDEVEGTSAELKKIVVKEGNAYIWYSDDYNNFNTLYKFTMNISGETIKLENKQSYHFPENVQSKNKYNGNVNVNEMVLIDDNIYIAVGMGHDVYSYSVKYESDYGDFESRGCVLKFNTLNNRFNVLGLCEESKTVTTKDWYGFYDDSAVPPPPGMEKTIISSKETSQKYYKLYLDKNLQNRITTKVSIETFMPDVEDSKFFGYVTGFAIKPKKLVCAQNRNFIYSDTDFDTIKRINAYSTVDLHDFVISDYTKGEAADDYKLIFSSCSSLSVDGINTDTELWYDKDGTATKVGNFSGIFSFN